jgi:predicted transcriptional regulator
LSSEVEFSHLEKIINYYKNKNKDFVYISHRRETAKKLELLQDRFHVQVIRFNNPVEIQFLLMEVHPFGIASFISTALFTVSKMFDFACVEAFYLPTDEISIAYRQDIVSVYDEYQKTMRVVNLNEFS